MTRAPGSGRSIGELRFVVVGAHVMDCFVRTSVLPRWGVETEVESVRTSPGGKALNQAVALARLGAQVTAVGVVGDDGPGADVLAALRREGIDAGGIRRRAGVATAVCVCLVGDAGESSILWHIDDEAAVTSDVVRDAAEAIRNADGVLVTFEMSAESVREAISIAADGEARVVVQPAPPMLDEPAAASLPWGRVDVLVPNEDEARALLRGGGMAADVPVDQLADALAAWLDVPSVVVTLGASGCVSCVGRSSRRYPAHEAVAVDTTGAGDAFVAALAACLVAGLPEADAVHAAQAAAAKAVQRPGGHESMPSY